MKQQACPLNPRHRAILSLVIQGKEDREIAEALGSLDLVIQKNIQEIYKRLHVMNRMAAAVIAYREGWIDLPPYTPYTPLIRDEKG